MPPQPPLQPGTIVEGTVANIVDFGAFVDIDVGDDTVTGLVHVSEFGVPTDNPYAHVAVGDPMTVKVISVRDNGKVDLSQRQADPDFDPDEHDLSAADGKDFNRKLRRFMHRSQRLQGERRRQQARRLDPAAYKRRKRRRR